MLKFKILINKTVMYRLRVKHTMSTLDNTDLKLKIWVLIYTVIDLKLIYTVKEQFGLGAKFCARSFADVETHWGMTNILLVLVQIICAGD